MQSALKFLVLYSFFVYIGIAYFENQYLMIPYVLIPALLFFYNFENSNNLGKNELLLALIFLFSISIGLNLITGSFGDAWITLVINFLIFIFILEIFGRTIVSIKVLSSFLNIYLLGLACAIAYGVFQIFFGYRDFELRSIERMGSLLIEFEKMGRFRVTSTFVDPLLSSFTFSIGFFICWLKIAISKLDEKSRGTNLTLGMLAIGSLAMMASTLTRAPILGCIVGIGGAILTNYSSDLKSSIKTIILSFAVFLIGYFLLESANNSELVEYPESLKAIISMKSLFDSIDPSDDSYFLVGQSRDHRLSAIGIAFDYMIENFGSYGDSIKNPASLNISFVDIGLLKIGVLSGLMTYVLLEIIYLYLLWKIWKIAVKEHDSRYRLIASVIFGLWLSIIVAINISDISLAIMPSIFIWMFGAVICNFNLIFEKYTKNV